MAALQWRSSEQLAWTEREGPGASPPGMGTRYLSVITVVLGLTMAVFVAGNSLCPEHRSWVRALGVFGVAATFAALAALARRSAAGPVLALVGATVGAAIGAIDSLHDPRRGALVLSGFACAGALAIVPVVRQLQSAAWARRIQRQLTPSADLLFGPDAKDNRPAAEEADAGHLIAGTSSGLVAINSASRSPATW